MDRFRGEAQSSFRGLVAWSFKSRYLAWAPFERNQPRFGVGINMDSTGRSDLLRLSEVVASLPFNRALILITYRVFCSGYPSQECRSTKDARMASLDFGHTGSRQ